MLQKLRNEAFWWGVAVIGLATVLTAWRVGSPAAWANQLVPAATHSSGLITHVQEGDGRATRVIVIDPQLQVMGVYDISRENGEIQLRSIRRLSADLQMLEFNSGEPSPADIQSRLEQP